MPDIRDILKGLSIDDRALYTETRTNMRRAYLSAHSKVLTFDNYDTTDDAFLDLLDIKIAMLFDRAGVFSQTEGSLDIKQAKETEQEIESEATRLMKTQNFDSGNANQGWPIK